MARRKTRYTGVYERPSSTRKFQGKADVAFDYCVRLDGKLVWQCAGWRSEGMTAAEAANRRQDAMRLAKKSPLASMTFGEAWRMYRTDWLEAQRKACLPNDINLYERWLCRRIGHLPMGEVQPLHLNAILKDMDALSDQTKKHAMALVRRVYRKMTAWRLWSGEVPTADMMPGRIDNERKRYLTKSEAGLLLQELDRRSPTVADICRASMYAGLRRSEILALRVMHIDFERGRIAIMDAKAGSRWAMMNESLAAVLRPRCQGKRPDAWVFTQEDGETQLRWISHVFDRAVRDLGLNDGIEDRRHKVVFHTLRHSFGSWLVQQDVPIYTVGDLMGHASLEMTRRYAKLADEDRKRAVALLDDVK